VRTTTRSALGIAALSLAFTSIMTAPASAQAPGPDDGTGGVDPGLLSAMAEELGTDTAGALDVLAFQDTANATTATLADETGAAYAGSWLDESTRTVYTAVTTADARQAVESAGAVPVAQVRFGDGLSLPVVADPDGVVALAGVDSAPAGLRLALLEERGNVRGVSP